MASNPRLVKEADALQSAGFQVRVVAGNYMPAIQPLDQTILSQAPWSWVQVELGTKTSYFSRRLWQEAAKKLARIGWVPHLSIATWAHSPVSMQLAQAAMAEPADLYIAHCLAALPAAAIAAKKHHARLGFDAEDFHVGELLDTPENQIEIRVRDRIERTLLPRCHHLTAASPGIAAAYAKRYGVSMQPILNVFSLSEAPASPPRQQDRLGQEPSLYWFSQTIGPGRGLELIVQALGKMDNRVRLCLRGIPSVGYVEQLTQLAKQLGIDDRLQFLPPAPPNEMVRLAAEHDLGLSLELTHPHNRAICLTNKIFTYLLAGLPVVMSHTPAQAEFSQHIEGAAILINTQNPEAIALALDAFFCDPRKLENARAKAWALGRSQYNWEIEQQILIDSVERALAASSLTV